MYSETAKVGVEVDRRVESQMLLGVLAPSEKGPETKRLMCFGTSEVYSCGHMECPAGKTAKSSFPRGTLIKDTLRLLLSP